MITLTFEGCDYKPLRKSLQSWLTRNFDESVKVKSVRFGGHPVSRELQIEFSRELSNAEARKISVWLRNHKSAALRRILDQKGRKGAAQ